ncbi:MAG TPA: hypothetical protein VMV98_08170 [Acidobacteriaceae bacterium]|nr:hypothetical protein [Acidobacteriaceae bacterium]
MTFFIVAYGLGGLVAGRVIDRVGARKGLALSIAAKEEPPLLHRRNVQENTRMARAFFKAPHAAWITGG